MRTTRPESGARSIRWSRGIVLLVPLAAAVAAPSRAEDADWREARKGRELFLRDWRVGDSRSHGGDGLGPLYNATSCVACHGLGGPGGAGPRSTNVDLLNLAKFDQLTIRRRVQGRAQAQGLPQGRQQAPSPARTTVSQFPLDRDAVIDRLHPGLRDSPSIVLHHFAADPGYASWHDRFNPLSLTDVRRQRVAQNGATDDDPDAPDDVALIRQLAQSRRATVTQRNPTPLFGAGLIDAVPDEAMEAAARESEARSPGQHGRVHRLKGGIVGRFGWKAQVGTLQEFVLTACGNELGLENPGHRQAMNPFDPDKLARRPDLTGAECDALVAFVRDLPSPTALDLGSGAGEAVREGAKLFDSTGCASCHLPRLGGVDGIYSDLLLHDMGSSLSDSGQYYGSDDSGSSGGPSPSEWRTPPLWGLRESAPYLHDGRADTLEEAITHHGGEAQSSVQKYRALSTGEKLRLETFLKTLTAPASPKLLASRTDLARDELAHGLAAESAEARERQRQRDEERARKLAEAEKDRLAREARRVEGQLQMAQRTEANGHTRAALDLYRELVRDHPGTRPAREAQARIEALGR